ncbi:unnamed protein product [Peniophora sp. CBMAI 1063]|nr:unnamed protein product [Peniophora sp. CBMAI 1063]
MALGLTDLPLEVLRRILILRLDIDLPSPTQRQHLIDDSYASAVQNWRDIKILPMLCTPSGSCASDRGARSGQTRGCHRLDTGPLRSALDLGAVCRHLREVVLGDALFWSEALLLNPQLVRVALSRAKVAAHPRLSFVAHGGACLCILDIILREMVNVRRLDLALPSTNTESTRSPSALIADRLLLGAPLLEEIEVRCDYAYVHEDSLQKRRINVKNVSVSRLINCAFGIESKNMTRMFFAAEAPPFRWPRGEFYKMLAVCVNLEVLSLQMIFVYERGLPPNTIYPPGDTFELPSLRFFHIADHMVEWDVASRKIIFPATCRVHPDVTAPMQDLYTPDMLATTVGRVFPRHPVLAAGETHCVTFALRVRDTTRTQATHFPEYLSLSRGRTEADAMAFRDPISLASAGTITLRNERLSMRTTITPQPDFGEPDVGQLVAGFVRGCVWFGLSYAEMFVLDGAYPHLATISWRDVLPYLPNVQTIVIRGLTTFSAPEIVDLAYELGVPQGQGGDGLESDVARYRCERLRRVRLPDARDIVPEATIANLRFALFTRRATRMDLDNIYWSM